MSGLLNIYIMTIVIAILFSVPAFTGRKGSETREKVDDTVEGFAGKKSMDQMKVMEKDLGKIKDQQYDRLKPFDKSDDE